MNPRYETLLVFCVLVGVLLVASLIAFVLKQIVAHGEPHPTIDNLTARINSWWVMIAAVGGALAFGRKGVIILFALVSFAALREFITLTYTRRGDHDALALCFFVVLPVQYWLVWVDWYGLYSIFIPVYVFLVLSIVAALAQDSTRFLERTAKVQWGVMICIFCMQQRSNTKVNCICW